MIATQGRVAAQSTTMPTTTDSISLLRRIADRTITVPPASTHADFVINFDEWQWHQGVALYGIVRAYKVTGDERYLRFVTDWVDRHLAKGSPAKSINTTAPLLAVTYLYERTHNTRYRHVCEEFAEWCLQQAPRLPDGTYEHSCTENRYPQQVWADTLFMGGLFLAKWGRLTGDARCTAEATHQFVRHYAYLQDPATGLIRHGYSGLEQRPIGVLWGRGNGWFAAASLEVLSYLDATQPGHDILRTNLRRHLDAVTRVQGAAGAWHTVMDQTDTLPETSCTAAFAYALGGTAIAGIGGELDGPCYERALAWLYQCVNERGEVLKSSGGTPIKPTADAYNAVPYAVTGFSQGLAMMALSRASAGGGVSLGTNFGIGRSGPPG